MFSGKILDVNIISASGLPASDDTLSSDPFCMVGLVDSPWIEEKGEPSWSMGPHQTVPLFSTCNPMWLDAVFTLCVLFHFSLNNTHKHINKSFLFL